MSTLPPTLWMRSALICINPEWRYLVQLDVQFWSLEDICWRASKAKYPRLIARSFGQHLNMSELSKMAERLLTHAKKCREVAT